MTSVGFNNLSLKYKRFEPSGCKDIGTRKFELVAKTQTLSESGAYTRGGISPQSAPRKLVARVLYVLRGGGISAPKCAPCCGPKILYTPWLKLYLIAFIWCQ